MNVDRIRQDFPILQRTVHGKPLVYLDNAATTQKPRPVIDALVAYYEQTNANVHRAIHALGEEATRAFEEARKKVARFINAPDEASIVFVKNTTEAINLVARTWGHQHITSGDTIVLTPMEHHSNLVPWQQLARTKGDTLKYVRLTDDGRIDMESLEEALKLSPKL